LDSSTSKGSKYVATTNQSTSKALFECFKSSSIKKNEHVSALLTHNSSLAQESSLYPNNRDNRENESVRANISHHLDAVARD